MSYQPDLFNDYVLLNLGTFIKNTLNERGRAEFQRRPDHYDGQIPNVVNAMYPLDFPSVSNLEYPVLKLQRLSCTSFRYGGNGNGVRNCNISITYSVTHPVLKLIPNLLNWVDYHIQQMLLEYELAHPEKPVDKSLLYQADRSEYRTMVNNMTQVEYPFLRILVNLREDYCYEPEYDELKPLC